jgi:hypothetical protein
MACGLCSFVLLYLGRIALFSERAALLACARLRCAGVWLRSSCGIPVWGVRGAGRSRGVLVRSPHRCALPCVVHSVACSEAGSVALPEWRGAPRAQLDCLISTQACPPLGAGPYTRQHHEHVAVTIHGSRVRCLLSPPTRMPWILDSRITP